MQAISPPSTLPQPPEPPQPKRACKRVKKQTAVKVKRSQSPPTKRACRKVKKSAKVKSKSLQSTIRRPSTKQAGKKVKKSTKNSRSQRSSCSSVIAKHQAARSRAGNAQMYGLGRELLSYTMQALEERRRNPGDKYPLDPEKCRRYTRILQSMKYLDVIYEESLLAILIYCSLGDIGEALPSDQGKGSVIDQTPNDKGIGSTSDKDVVQMESNVNTGKEKSDISETNEDAVVDTASRNNTPLPSVEEMDIYMGKSGMDQSVNIEDQSMDLIQMKTSNDSMNMSMDMSTATDSVSMNRTDNDIDLVTMDFSHDDIEQSLQISQNSMQRVGKSKIGSSTSKDVAIEKVPMDKCKRRNVNLSRVAIKNSIFVKDKKIRIKDNNKKKKKKKKKGIKDFSVKEVKKEKPINLDKVKKRKININNSLVKSFTVPNPIIQVRNLYTRSYMYI